MFKPRGLELSIMTYAKPRFVEAHSRVRLSCTNMHGFMSIHSQAQLLYTHTRLYVWPCMPTNQRAG